MKPEVLYYPAQQLQLWKAGELPKEWRGKYPRLFKDADWRHVQNQLDKHFGEWFTALHYYKRGYRVLIEKYVFPKSHFEDCSIAENLLGKECFCFLREHARCFCQPPDLLVYRRDFQSFFFVEVKLGPDHLRPNQEVHFKRLGKMINQKIYLVELKPKPSAEKEFENV